MIAVRRNRASRAVLRLVGADEARRCVRTTGGDIDAAFAVRMQPDYDATDRNRVCEQLRIRRKRYAQSRPHERRFESRTTGRIDDGPV